MRSTTPLATYSFWSVGFLGDVENVSLTTKMRGVFLPNGRPVFLGYRGIHFPRSWRTIDSVAFLTASALILMLHDHCAVVVMMKRRPVVWLGWVVTARHCDRTHLKNGSFDSASFLQCCTEYLCFFQVKRYERRTIGCNVVAVCNHELIAVDFFLSRLSSSYLSSSRFDFSRDNPRSCEVAGGRYSPVG